MADALSKLDWISIFKIIGFLVFNEFGLLLVLIGFLLLRWVVLRLSRWYRTHL